MATRKIPVRRSVDGKRAHPREVNVPASEALRGAPPAPEREQLHARLMADTSLTVEELQAIAKDPSVTSQTLDLLAARGWHQPTVTRRVAGNSRTSATTLHSLATSPDHDTKFEVLRNVNTGAPTLRVLARDSDPSIRGFLVGAPNVTRDVLEQLAKDRSAYVRRDAKHALEMGAHKS